MIGLHFYDISGFLSKEGTDPWQEPCNKHVVAESVAIAVGLVMKAHPDLEIDSIENRGKIDIAQEMSSDANSTETYYCDDPNCIDHSDDGTTVRPKLERNEHGIWFCPSCIHFYGIGAFPVLGIKG